MKRLNTTSLARLSGSHEAVHPQLQIEKITKLTRLSSTMELLESRTMMSAGTLPAPAAPLLSAAKTASAKVSVASSPAAVVKPAAKSTVKKAAGPVKTIVIAPPATPASLLATGLSRTQIKLTWTESGSAATGYYVLRATDGIHFTQISKPASTSFTDSGLTAGQAYKYEVQAFNSTATSAVSSVATGVTLLTAPSGLAVSASSSSQLNLTWVDNDSSATGYLVLRSTDGVHFTQISKLTTAGANKATDSTALPFTKYYYEIQAATAAATSPASNIASATTPLAVPTGITAIATAPASVTLTWTDSDPAAKGYDVYRAADGKTFTQVGLTVSGKTTTWTDTTVSSDHAYSYEVKAVNGSSTSALSAAAVVTTPLVAPTNLVANASSGTSVQLTWTDHDSSATGYNISRSTDGKVFLVIAKLTSGTATTYTDSTVSSAHTYYYQVQAFSAAATSPVSNTATVAIASPAVVTSTVSIATRYGSELVITANGKNDTVSVTQNGSFLTIIADGQTTIQPVPTDGLFIYTRGGTDGISIDQSVTVQTTIEAIDAATDTIASHGADVSIWDDPTDIFTGTGTVHSVSAFAGAVSKALGASLKDPSDSGTIMHASASLWGSGPVAGDVNQGDSGDCYFLSSLAAFAGVQPAMLQESAVDMGDGTYTVQFISNNQPEYIRVSNDLPTRGGGNYLYARPGASGSIWAAIMEKAYAFFRTGANTYASISSGWMGDVYTALGVKNSFFYPSGMSQSALYSTLSADLNNGEAVTLGTFSSAPNLVSGHAYTLVSVSMNNGVASYVVRNPWGVAGDSLENSQGYATLTYSQLEANFQDICQATS